MKRGRKSSEMVRWGEKKEENWVLSIKWFLFHSGGIIFPICQRTKYNTAITYKSSPSFYTFYTAVSLSFFFVCCFFLPIGKRHLKRVCMLSQWGAGQGEALGRVLSYASGSLRSSSPWESSSFFSSVLAREERLVWAPMYRVAYTGLVKLVGCRTGRGTWTLRHGLNVHVEAGLIKSFESTRQSMCRVSTLA